MTPTPFDFRKPGPLASGLEPQVAGWWRRACALATDSWAKSLPFPLQACYESADLVSAAEALAQMSDQTVGYPVVFQQTIPTVLCWPRPLTLAVVQGLLGEKLPGLPADRDATLIEDSLFEFFLKDLLIQAWHETWQGSLPCQARLDAKEPNVRWGKWFDPAQSLIVATFRLTGAFGEHRWQWLMPKKSILEQLNPALKPRSEGTAPQLLEGLVQELPMDLSVILGSAELLLSQLAALRPGDVIVLNQRVTQPLNAYLGGKHILSGWPGRVGTRQAYRIQSCDGQSDS